MSVIDTVLSRYGLSWGLHPYRIFVASHPHLTIQTGPTFDLREYALAGARERALTTERKRRQRQRFGSLEMSRQPGLMEQYNAPVGGHLAISKA